MNLNEDVEKKILRGEYSFIYLVSIRIVTLPASSKLTDFQSPEVLLKNTIFTRIFCNNDFQNHVSLVVVDKAHMIYVWGLVASGKSKNSSLMAAIRIKDYFVHHTEIFLLAFWGSMHPFLFYQQPVDRKQLNIY
jgi:hypothetical protein